MNVNSTLQINSETLIKNIKTISSSLAHGARLVPVLKGNAYGLGAVGIAGILSGHEGIDTFAVAHVSEGLELREAGFCEEIWVMSLPLDFQLETAAENNLVITLGSFRQFEKIKELSVKFGKRIPVQIKLDTGLHRIGFLPDEIDALIHALSENIAYLDIKGTFSHFADSVPEHMDEQYSVFLSGIEQMKNAGISVGLRHISSSASVEYSNKYDLDAVRIGRRMYMDNPYTPLGNITEAATFKAYIADIRLRFKGESLAYGGNKILDKDTRVGLVSIGYGDGLNVAFSDINAPVLVNGKKAHLLASCMDQSFIDLGDIDCTPGDEVVFFGYDSHGGYLSSQDVANLIGGYEGCGLTEALTTRVKREYI